MIIEQALRDLISVSERMRDRAGYVKRNHAHHVTASEWKSWALQLKVAKGILLAAKEKQD
jgi:hypothetical protein